MSDDPVATFSPNRRYLFSKLLPPVLLVTVALLAVPKTAPSTVHPLAYLPAAVCLLACLALFARYRDVYAHVGATYAVYPDRLTVSGPFTRGQRVALSAVRDVSLEKSERYSPQDIPGYQWPTVGRVEVHHELGPPLVLRYVSRFEQARRTLERQAAEAGAPVDPPGTDGRPGWLEQ